MNRSVKRYALNRGTAVYRGKANVTMVWPCGCTKMETVTAVGGRPLPAKMVEFLVARWRTSGVRLAQCRKHPDWYSKQSQVQRLNEEHPQPDVVA